MKIAAATPSDLEQAVRCLASAFAQDPIIAFLLRADPDSQQHAARFFLLLLKARMSLGMPVLVARDGLGLCGAVMGNNTAPPPWPSDLEEEWGNLEIVVPGFHDRAAIYDEISEKHRPPVPHYYLGAIGVSPAKRSLGIGKQLLQCFCDLSASDPLSAGVYLETANESNVRLYERAGFAVTGRGELGAGPLWCMFLRWGPR